MTTASHEEAGRETLFMEGEEGERKGEGGVDVASGALSNGLRN